MIIYKYIYKDNEVNLGFYTTRKCWKLMKMATILYERHNRSSHRK